LPRCARATGAKAGYTYGLHGTPTTFTLEERIATLEGGTQCVLAPSGLAAIALVDQALLSPGDEVLLPANVYGPSRELARHELARWASRTGCTTRWTRRPGRDDRPADAAGLAGGAGLGDDGVPRPAPAWWPRQGAGVLTALDNTWGAGIAFAASTWHRHRDAGADQVPLGRRRRADGLGGPRATRLHERMKLTHMRLGLGVAANDAELVLRSLPSIALRYHAHDATGAQLAAWLAARPEVAQVLHPALEGSPGHAHWRPRARRRRGCSR
jgi:cysteine-S-conjugate beta-lyase